MNLLSQPVLRSRQQRPSVDNVASGQHLVLDLSECEVPQFDEEPWLKTLLSEISRRADRAVEECNSVDLRPWGILIRVRTPAAFIAMHAIPRTRHASIAFVSDEGTIDLERSMSFAIVALKAKYTQLRYLYGGNVSR